MGPYATVDDLVAGWRWLSEAERLTAATLLSRASAMVEDALDKAGADFDAMTDARKECVRAVVCDMVRYSMVTGSMGQSQFIGDGVATQAARGDMEGGSLFMTRKHRSMLGIGGSAGFVGARHG